MKALVRETLKETGRVFGVALISVAICNAFDGFDISKLLEAIPVIVGVCLVYAVIYYFAHK